MEGKIKWFKREKGYGFVAAEDGKEYFVHHSALPQDQEDVRESDNIAVTFDLQDGRDGRVQAGNIVMKGSESSSDEEGEKEEEVEESPEDETL